MPFIHEDFLLQTQTARRLYHEHARDLPLFDYHCHLSPEEVATDRHWEDLYSIWLAGDHYKWRAMRTNGVPETHCTGAAPPYEKFLAWAKTVPKTLRNPLYHWSHLELKRYFGIDTLLNESTANAIWEEAGRRLAAPDFSAQGILTSFRVAVVCTTDDPTDDLRHHRSSLKSGLTTKMYPTFRPDKALRVDQAEAFSQWCDRLASVSGIATDDYSGFLEALEQRHGVFHELGARLSDHGLEYCPSRFTNEEEAEKIFARARTGESAIPAEQEAFASQMMLHFGRWDAKRGWTKQLHLGAMRNNNSRLFRSIGPDIGCDSIGDWSQALALSRYLNRLDEEDSLPKVILYNLNPADNYVMGTMIGNFQDGRIPGKVQFGSGWWFLDQKEAMEWQLNALSNLGLLSRFVGMLTDSRSFLSYPRHEYFRRVLCNLIGRDVESGELPNDDDLLGPFVRGICFENARDYFGLQLS